MIFQQLLGEIMLPVHINKCSLEDFSIDLQVQQWTMKLPLTISCTDCMQRTNTPPPPGSYGVRLPSTSTPQGTTMMNQVVIFCRSKSHKRF